MMAANSEGQERPVFCAGADLKAINSGNAAGLNTKRGGFAGFVYRDRKKPVIVAVDGLATAGGCEIVLAADNALLRAAKCDGVTVAVHICLGTYILGPQGALGGGGSTYVAPTIGRIIDSLEADTFLIEYSGRSGSLESLRDVPKGKTISLGLINIRDPQVEAIDDVMHKIEAAAKFVPVENLSICPSCGFSGASADAWISQDIERRKLDVMVETARRVWG